MIFKNDKISSVQLRKMLILSSLGITCFLSTRLSVDFVMRDGLICIIVASLLSLLYAVIILYLCDVTNWNFFDYIRKYFGEHINKVICIIFMIKYFVMGVIALSVFVKIVREQLLTEESALLIMIPAIVLGVYSATRGVEARARMTQAIYYFIIIPILILILLSIKGVDKYYLVPFFTNSGSKILYSGALLCLFFCPIEVVLFISGNLKSDNYKEIKKNKHAVYYAILFTSVVNIIFFILNVGNLSVNEIVTDKYQSATVRLMGKLKIGAIFLERQDGLFLLFFLASIFMTVSALMYYVLYLLRRITSNKVDNKYLSLVLLAFAIIGAQLIIQKAPQFNKTRKVQDARVEIDARAYTNALIFSEKDGMYCVTMVFPHTKDGESDIINLQISELSQLNNRFRTQSSYKLDLSDTQVIGISESIRKSSTKYQKLVSYLRNSDELSENTFIIGVGDDVQELQEVDKKLSNPLGTYLSDLFRNNLESFETTLGDLFKLEVGCEEAMQLALFLPQNDTLAYCGVEVINQFGRVEQFTDNSAAVMNLVGGKKGYELSLGNTHAYQIDRNNYNVEISMIGDKTIRVNLVYTGKLTAMQKDDLSDEEINIIMESLIFERVMYLLLEYSCDYLNIYKYLAVDEPNLWVEYASNHEKMYQNIFVEVDARFER